MIFNTISLAAWKINLKIDAVSQPSAKRVFGLYIRPDSMGLLLFYMYLTSWAEKDVTV